MLIFAMFGIEAALFLISYYAIGRDLLRPSTLMLGMFLISTATACINVFNWKIDYSVITLTLMTLGLSSSVLADWLVFKFGNRRAERKYGGEGQALKSINVSKTITILIIVCEILVLILYISEIYRLALKDGYTQGSSLLWHFRNITSYQAEDSVNGMVSLLLHCIDATGYIYTYILIQNILAGNKKKQIINAAPVAIFIVKVLMGSGRMDILRWAAFVIIVGTITKRNRVGWAHNDTKQILKVLAIAIPIGLIVFYGLTNVIGRSTTRSPFDYITTYLGGSIQQFNQFVQNPIENSNAHFGEETFPGVYFFLKRIGLTDFSRSVHLELRPLGITHGNVYTFFRRPLNDFGPLGMCLMTLGVVALFSKWYSIFTYRKLTKNKQVATILFGYYYYWIVFSSIENYSIGIISIGSVFTGVMIYVIYSLIVSDGTVCLPGTWPNKTTLELDKFAVTHIDENVKENIRKLLIYKYALARIPIRNILRDYDDGLYALSNSLPYRVMQSNYTLTSEYETYSKKKRNTIDNPDRSLAQCRSIQKSIDDIGYDWTKSPIIIDQFNIVLDGQHRSCAIMLQNPTAEVSVLKVYRLRIRPRTLLRLAYRKWNIHDESRL